MMLERIVRNGYTPGWVLDKLEQRSSQTRIPIQLECPVCHTPFRTARHCGICEALVDIFQCKITETDNARMICIQAEEMTIELLRVDLRCLSCESHLRREGFCKGCGIETYLFLADGADGKHIQRWFNLPGVPRDEKIEIPLREIESKTSEADVTANIDTPKKTVAEQILEYLNENGGLGATGLMIETIGCSPQGFKYSCDKLIDEGKIKNVARGIYQLINRSDSLWTYASSNLWSFYNQLLINKEI